MGGFLFSCNGPMVWGIPTLSVPGETFTARMTSRSRIHEIRSPCPLLSPQPPIVRLLHHDLNGGLVPSPSKGGRLKHSLAGITTCFPIILKG